ncbi:hypothetical protein SCLCIDRAFT_1219059 [Scleroderma citrinum Foug A]|uniref:Uncharacterized protein n=1 Tax=Scleroderma citrinum Foug A TaxID=1036808 RepID=A0A0C3DAP2_9AGAM|nr:hypothetical protein SCLCIDRAFT_1219059 [Scleroderma citrinum Foug A]
MSRSRRVSTRAPVQDCKSKTYLYTPGHPPSHQSVAIGSIDQGVDAGTLKLHLQMSVDYRR